MGEAATGEEIVGQARRNLLKEPRPSLDDLLLPEDSKKRSKTKRGKYAQQAELSKASRKSSASTSSSSNFPDTHPPMRERLEAAHNKVVQPEELAKMIDTRQQMIQAMQGGEQVAGTPVSYAANGMLRFIALTPTTSCYC